MAATALLTTEFRALPATRLDLLGRVLCLLVKYNALMALSAAKLPFAAPPNVPLALIMICGYAASFALLVSVMAARAEKPRRKSGTGRWRLPCWSDSRPPCCSAFRASLGWRPPSSLAWDSSPSSNIRKWPPRATAWMRRSWSRRPAFTWARSRLGNTFERRRQPSWRAPHCRCCGGSIPSSRMIWDWRALKWVQPLWPTLADSGGARGAMLWIAVFPSLGIGRRLRQERRLSGCARRTGIQPYRARHRDAASATGQSQAAHVQNSRPRCADQPHGVQQQGGRSPGRRGSRARRYRGIRGISIGKNFDTPIENAQDDYVACLRKVYAARGLRRGECLLAQHGALARTAGARWAATHLGHAARRAPRVAAALYAGTFPCWSRSRRISTPEQLSALAARSAFALNSTA